METTTPRPRRGYSAETSRVAAAAATWTVRGDDDAAVATWIFGGDGSRRRRGLDSPWRPVAATPWAATWIVRGDDDDAAARRCSVVARFRYHPEAVAAPRCRRDAEAAAACMKLALTWHTPFIVCDVLGILFADAGPRLLRVDDKSAILVDGNVTDAMRNARITKIDSRADLVEYASSEILDTHERLVPKVDSRTAKDYRYLTSPIKNPLPCEKRSFTPIADPKKMK